MTRSVCLITGAAGGLGQAIAQALHRRGVELHLVDADAERLRAVADEIGAAWTAVDLTDDEVAPSLFDPMPDLIVHAIGKGYFGTFTAIDAEQCRRSFDVNFFAPLFIGIEAMRRWRTAGTAGRMLTLSSISGYQAYSTSVAYGMAKHALESAMRILRIVGAPDGIQVGTICPTNVDTSFWNAVERDGAVELPARSAMIQVAEVVRAVVAWLDASRPRGVVFVPPALRRRQTRYGRESRSSGAAPAGPGVAVVSGASSGLGRELVHRLRRRGWRVAAVARDGGRLQTEFAGDDDVLCLPGDVADRGRMLEVVEQTVQRLGGLDLLVNNAGSSWIGPALDLEPAECRRVFETNLFGYFHLTKAALPSLEVDGGTILNVLSTTAIDPAIQALPYSCAKIAQAALSDRLKEDLAARGVRVVDLFPGNIRTGFFESATTPAGTGVPVPANAIAVEEVADAAMALLDGRGSTAIVPKHYGRRTLRQRVRRLLGVRS